MTPTLIGKKLKMTQIYDETGQMVPVTVILAGPCQVVQVKTVEGKDHYQAAQIGFDDVKAKNTPKPQQGHFKKWSATPKRIIREVRLDTGETLAPGSQVDVSVFEGVGYVDVTGTSKGRGFAGKIRRHSGTNCGPKSHGTKAYRKLGSQGMHTWPARVLMGKRQPGHMGARQRTERCLRLVKIEKEQNLLYVKGAIPGPTNGFVVIRRAKTRS